MGDLLRLFEQYKEDPLVIGLVGIVLGAILTKLIPAIWSFLYAFTIWLGKKVGGRFSFRDFEKSYLDWLVTEHSELKLTGIVTSDEAKKPKLEQVFVSLQLGRERDLDSTRGEPIEYLILQETIPSWNELRRLLLLQKSIVKDSEERKAIDAVLSNLSRQVFISRINKLKNLYNICITALRFLVPLSFLKTMIVLDEKANRKDWIKSHKDSFQDSVGDYQLRSILSQQRVAILGGPGTGKTTLLQYIALTYARERASDPKLRERGILKKRLGTASWRLPVFIRLSSIASMLLDSPDKDRSPSILDVLPRILPPDLQLGGIAYRYFAKQFKKGRCIVLLDGLDEVPTDEELKSVVRAIESLVVKYSLNQFTVTSRVAGWRTGISGDFAVHYVNDLTDKQVETFIDTWYAAVERNSVVGRLKDEGHAARKARERRSAQRAEDLKTTLHDNVGIRRLATNPMLLSIIALVHRSLATLPKERGKLYGQCSKILLEQWDISRGIRVDDTNLKLEQKEAVMRRLAIAYHTGEIGDRGGGREATRADVNKVIAQILPNLGRPPGDSAHLLQMLIERSGILVERRRDFLSFGHHTFQEYFTAQFLAAGERSWQRDFLLRPEIIVSVWWHEIILLYSSLLSDSSKFIRLILDQPLDDLCYIKLRLAALSLWEATCVEQTEVRQIVAKQVFKVRSKGDSTNVESLSFPEVIEYLLVWAKGNKWFSHAAIAKVRTAETEIDQASLYQELISSLDDSQVAIREAAFECLPFLDASLLQNVLTDKALSIIKTNNIHFLLRALLSIEELPKVFRDERVIGALLELLEGDDGKEISAAIGILKRINLEAIPTEALIKTLNKLSNNAPAKVEPYAFVLNLVSHREVKDEYVNAFFEFLVGDNPRLSGEAQTATIHITDAKLASALLDRIFSFIETKSISIKYDAILIAVSNLGYKGEIRAHILKEVFTKLKSKASRIAAIRALTAAGKMVKSTTLMDKELLFFFDSNNRSEKQVAFSLLRQIGKPRVSQSLIDRILRELSANDVETRIEAARTLVVAEGTPFKQTVINNLIRLASDSNADVRIVSLESITALSQGAVTGPSINCILSLLNDGDLAVQMAAVKAIERIGLLIPAPEYIDKVLAILRKAVKNKDRYTSIFFVVFVLSRRRKLFTRYDFIELIGVLARLGSQAEPVRVFNEILRILNQGSHLLSIDLLLNPISKKRKTDIDWLPVYTTGAIGSELKAFLTDVGRVPKKQSQDEKLNDYMVEIVNLGGQLPLDVLSTQILNAMNDGEMLTRVTGLILLAVLAEDDMNDAVKIHVVKCLEDKELEVRLGALEAAASMARGSSRGMLLNGILKRLRDTNQEVRERAWKAIQEVV